MLNKKMTFLGTAVLLMILTACSTTKLSGTWQDESLSGKKFQKLLIIGAAKQQNVRELFENEFVRQLKDRGIKAIPSYTIISAENMLDKDTIISHIAKNGIDAVLITRMTGSKGERGTETGNTYRVPYAYYNQMHEYYKKGLETNEEPSPLTTHKVIILETNIYNAATEKLAWATASDVYVQDATYKLTKDFIKVIVNKLGSDKVI
jgi:hypothetical protein